VVFGWVGLNGPEPLKPPAAFYEAGRFVLAQ
jgi:hypothetical protein